jgi:hypothetical protein
MSRDNVYSFFIGFCNINCDAFGCVSICVVLTSWCDMIYVMINDTNFIHVAFCVIMAPLKTNSLLNGMMDGREIVGGICSRIILKFFIYLFKYLFQFHLLSQPW